MPRVLENPMPPLRRQIKAGAPQAGPTCSDLYPKEGRDREMERDKEEAKE